MASQLLSSWLLAVLPLLLVAAGFSGQVNGFRTISLSLVPCVAIGGYGARAVQELLGTGDPLVSLLGGVVCSAALGVTSALTDAWFTERGRMFGFFASVGYLKLCQGLITVATGGGIGVLTIGGYGLASLGGVLAAPEWTGIAVVTMTAALVANAWFLRHSLTGIAAIALGDDPALSLLFGIRPVLVRIVVYSVGGATAGLGGLFLAADSGLRPDVGFSVCLKAFAVLIVSGGRVPLVCLWSAVLVAVEIAAGYWWGGHAREATGLVFLGVVLLAARVYASAWRAKSEG